MATSQTPTAVPVDVLRKSNDRNRTTAGDASGGKYAVEQLTFPPDLFSHVKKYGKGWMMININMLQQSKYLSQVQQATMTPEEIEKDNRNNSNTSTRGSSVGGAAGSGAAAGALGALAGMSISDFLSNGKGGRSQAAAYGNVIRGAALGASGAAVGAYAGTMKRETKRIAAAIQLPMPNNLVTSYQMDWQHADTNIFDMIMRGLGNVTSGAMDAAAAAVLGANSIAQSEGLSAATGLAVNPKKEMYFNSVNFRQFQLEYLLYPKNAKDAQAIEDIIFTLKFHMHPEYKAEGRYTFVYPSEFDITFYRVGDNGAGEENLFVNKVATCVLSDMSVNYTPNNLWSVHEQGQPNAVQIMMTFRELTIHTKETIYDGF